MKSCAFCDKPAVYRCACCGTCLCPSHIHLQPVCEPCTKKTQPAHRIRTASKSDRVLIADLVKAFWGEPEQVMFGRSVAVAQEPAFVATVTDHLAGFISYADLSPDELIIVALAVLPEHQGIGIGRALVAAVERTANTESKKRMVVATSNDDLPALAFYQHLGFQLFEVAPDAIAAKHGRLETGIGSIPVRDELRLQKRLAQRKP
jgi:ribosomal protein S18 acetylase RimI-like enzyme